jgi:hypothetical protein
VSVDASRWRKNACEIIGSVADENYQRAAWFGKSRFISSPEEVYNQVFDDLAFEEFVASPEVSLNDLERAAAVALISKMLLKFESGKARCLQAVCQQPYRRHLHLRFRYARVHLYRFGRLDRHVRFRRHRPRHQGDLSGRQLRELRLRPARPRLPTPTGNTAPGPTPTTPTGGSSR